MIADNAYKIILERVLDGSITPEQAAKSYRAEATSILDTTDKGAAK